MKIGQNTKKRKKYNSKEIKESKETRKPGYKRKKLFQGEQGNGIDNYYKLI